MEVIKFDPVACPEAQETLRVALALSHIEVEIASSARIVCLTGAGTSTSAGIRDFRSKDAGHYTRPSSHPPSSSPSDAPPPPSTRALFHSSVYATSSSRCQHLRFTAALHAQVSAIADATPTHAFFAALKKAGKLLRVWTQNIDALEERQGLSFVRLPGVTPGYERGSIGGEEGWSPARLGKRKVEEEDDGWEGDVVQLHGSLEAVRCTVCEAVVSWEAEHQAAFAAGRTLDCSNCLDRAATRATLHKRSTPPTSFLRPAILLYDEPSPAATIISSLAEHDLSQSPSLLLVFGTSLQIPGFKRLVRDFARAVRSNNGFCVLVNLDSVAKEWEDVFDYHIQGTCDNFVTRILFDLAEISPASFSRSIAYPTPPPDTKRQRLVTPSPPLDTKRIRLVTCFPDSTRPTREMAPKLHAKLLAAFEGLRDIANGVVSNLPYMEDWSSSEEEDLLPDSQPAQVVSWGVEKLLAPKEEDTAGVGTDLLVPKEEEMASSQASLLMGDVLGSGEERERKRKREMGRGDARVREQRRSRERSGRR